MKKEFKYLTIWSEDSDPDILFSSYSPRLEIDISIARELISNRLEFTSGQPAYVLIDFSQVKSVTKEARDFMNSPEGGLNGILAGAFLSSNVVATLFINLFLKVSKPIVPARFFNNQADALNWLRKIKSEKFRYA
jgi:hypothetical protein